MAVIKSEILIVFLLLWPLAGALLCLLTRRGGSSAEGWLAPLFAVIELAAAVCCALLPGDIACQTGALGGWAFSFSIGGFGKLFLILTAFMWAACLMQANDCFKTRPRGPGYSFFSLFTLFATMGVFMAGDLFTGFVFFEMMSLASYTWVAHDKTPSALRAANTYLAVGIFGGMAALMGLFLIYVNLGTLELDKLSAAAALCENKAALYAAGACVLAGYGAKAGMFPLQFWMPKAYPSAPAPSTALLSSILSKTGVLGMLYLSCRIFSGDGSWAGAILALGIVTMALGAVMALFSTDLKRTLACSSMSQIGFIMTGVACAGALGAHGGLAAWGAAAHMVNHSLIKMLLFCAAGVLLSGAGTYDLNKLRGYGRGKPLLMLCFLAGALAVGGVPFFSGYASKTLLHEAIVEYAATLTGSGAALVTGAEWVFIICGGLTLAYMTKIFAAIFIEKGPGQAIDKKPVFTGWSAAAIVLPAAALIALGAAPNALLGAFSHGAAELAGAEPVAHGVSFFTLGNLKGFFISAAVGAAVYFGAVRGLLLRGKGRDKRYVNPIPAWFDMEELVIRPVFCKWLPDIFGWIMSFFGENRLLAPLAKQGLKFFSLDMKLLSDMPEGAIVLARRTVFKDLKEPSVEKNRYRAAYRLGAALDRQAGPENERGMARRLVGVAAATDKTGRKLAGSLSFSLLLSLLGACALMVYLFIKIL